MISSILAASLFFLSCVSAQVDTCARTYNVVDGDYCDSISAAHNSSTYQLAVSNYQTINDGCTNLDVGETICLGIIGQDCQSTYVVNTGDTCSAIASAFGLNTTLLMSNNPQIDDACDNIYVGEVLCVASTSLVTPPPAGWTLPGSNLDDGSSDITPVDTSSTTSSTPSSTVASVTSTTISTSAATTSTAALTPVDNAEDAPLTSSDGTNCTDDDGDDDDGDDDDDDDSDDDGSDDNDDGDCDDTGSN